MLADLNGKLVSVQSISWLAILLVAPAFTIMMPYSPMLNATPGTSDTRLWPGLPGNGTIPPLPLGADFQYSPASPTTVSGVLFVAIAKNGIPPYSFTWDFGDNSSSNSQSPSHEYMIADNYSVMLTVRDLSGHFAKVMKRVAIKPPPPPALLVNFTMSINSPVVGQRIIFTSDVQGGVPPYTLLWSFGDKHPGNKTKISHTYYAPGEYNVSLTAKDSAGQTTVSSLMISVGPAPREPSSTVTTTGAQDRHGSSTGPTIRDEVMIGAAVAVIFAGIGAVLLWKRAFLRK